jgi:WD40 repeat protein
VAALCGEAVTVWRGGAGAALPAEHVRALAMARGGALLTWSADGVLRAWTAGGAARTVAVVEPAGSLLAVTPDGARAVAASGRDLVWIDVATGAIRRQPAGRAALVSLAIAPDGALAAAGQDDNQIALHRRGGGQPRFLRRHTVPPVVLAFSPDGASLVSGGLNAVILYWDLASEVSRMIAGHWAPILALGFDPDGAVRSISEVLSRRTPDDLPRDEAGLRAWIARALSPPRGAPARPPAPAR